MNEIPYGWSSLSQLVRTSPFPRSSHGETRRKAMSAPMTDLEIQMRTLSALPGLTRPSRALLYAAGAVQFDGLPFHMALEQLSDPELSGFNLPSSEGRKMAREIGELLGEEAPESCCETCAFRAGTIPNQCASTLAQALDCVVNGDVFLCHSTGKACEGWRHAREGATV